MRLTIMPAGIMALVCLGCGSDNKGASSPPVATEPLQIHGITVPPTPPSDTMNATLIGVDKNTNGVRDEVDRALAQSYGASASEYNAAVTFAASEQKWLLAAAGDQSSAKAMVLAELSSYGCLKSKVGTDRARIVADEVELRTFNINSRIRERRKLLQMAGVFELPIAVSEPC